MQKKVDQITKHLSLLYRVPEKEIKDAVNSQFLFVKKIIESATKDELETFKTVKLRSFGTFLVNKSTFSYMLRNKQLKKEREENGNGDK